MYLVYSFAICLANIRASFVCPGRERWGERETERAREKEKQRDREREGSLKGEEGEEEEGEDEGEGKEGVSRISKQKSKKSFEYFAGEA